MSDNNNVSIMNKKTLEVVTKIQCGTFREAEQVARGILLNLHGDYCVYIDNNEMTIDYE